MPKRETVFRRDNWTCRGCGFRQTEPERRRDALGGTLGRYLTVDHVIPRSKGGKNALENLQTLCNVCNGEKADRIPPGRAQIVPWREGAIGVDYALRERAELAFRGLFSRSEVAA